MKKFGAILVAILMLALAMTPAFAESVSQQRDIVTAVNVDFTTMDPMDTSDTLSGGIQRMIMDGLFGFDDNMKIIPMLATGYTANDDATEFTITLREGISFSDGTPWNADAALVNICYFLNEELDGYIRTGLESADDAVRAEAYAKAQDLIWEETPMIMLCADSNTWATSANIQNVKLYPDGALNFRNGKMTE